MLKITQINYLLGLLDFIIFLTITRFTADGYIQHHTYLLHYDETVIVVNMDLNKQTHYMNTSILKFPNHLESDS